MSRLIRLASAEDANAVLAIYAPIVLDTPISFEFEPPSIEEMRRRIVTTLERLPWIVFEQDGAIRGYAYASRHNERAAYQWSVNVSVYVADDARGAGIGRALYLSLFEFLRLQGFFTAFAGITLPNPASVGLHESLGFEPVGVYHSSGWKKGIWYDVGWWRLPLREPVAEPAPPLGIEHVRASSAWTSVRLTRGHSRADGSTEASSTAVRMARPRTKRRS